MSTSTPGPRSTRPSTDFPSRSGVAYDYQNYDDVKSIFGTNIDQDYRDGDVIETGGRVSYLISPGYRVFGDFRYNWRDYNDDGGDSDGWRALDRSRVRDHQVAAR